MATPRFSSLGVVSSMSLLAALGCAGLLGIEDATCDEGFDERCTPASAGGAPPFGGVGGASAAGTGGAAPAAGTGGALAAGGSAGGGAAGAGGSAPAVEEAPLCERYCNTVAAACTGENEQYASIGGCLNVCALLEAGEEGTIGNTVECRLARAELAQATGEPASYCFSAGPGGAGVCGSNCEGFCAIMAQTCTLMGAFEDCLPLCAQVPDLSGPPSGTTYNTSLQSGDSVQCRLYHVTAATLDSVTHCSHAAGVALCADD
jgi:hypothetical protein